jgi:PmbA protein
MKMNLQSTSDSGLKSTDSCHELLLNTLNKCQELGASDASIDFQQDIGFSIDVRMGGVDSVSFHQSQGLAIEVYVGQRKGLASTTDLRSSAVEKMIQAAVDMARVSAIDPFYGLVPPGEPAKIDLDLYHPWAITPEDAIVQALALEDLARQKDKRIVNSNGASISTYQMLSASMNSKGFEEHLLSTQHHMMCALLAQKNKEMQTDYAYTAARRAIDLDSIEELASIVAQRVCERLGSRHIPTQKAPVVFSNRVSSELIGHFLGAIQGGQLYRRNSFLCDSLGQQLFPSFMKMQEFPHLPRALASALYDADGLATQNNIIVEDGKLLQYILSVYTARRLGLSPTGNADGVHNLQVSANASDLEDILKQMGKGLLVTSLMGQGVNVLTGDYSRGAAGFWVEDGQIQYPVEGITIAGHLKDMFQGIALVGADHNKNRSTKCGSILISEMMLAGS